MTIQRYAQIERKLRRPLDMDKMGQGGIFEARTKDQIRVYIMTSLATSYHEG